MRPSNTIRVIRVLGIFLLLVSCNSNGKFSLLKNKLTQIDTSLLEKKKIVLIPNEGCGGCIQDATAVMVRNIPSKPEIAVVFTSIDDMKLFRLRLDKEFLLRPNVYIDEKNLFESDKLSSIYPQTFTIKNREVVSIDVFAKEEFDTIK